MSSYRGYLSHSSQRILVRLKSLYCRRQSQTSTTQITKDVARISADNSPWGRTDVACMDGNLRLLQSVLVWLELMSWSKTEQPRNTPLGLKRVCDVSAINHAVYVKTDISITSARYLAYKSHIS